MPYKTLLAKAKRIEKWPGKSWGAVVAGVLVSPCVVLDSQRRFHWTIAPIYISAGTVELRFLSNLLLYNSWNILFHFFFEKIWIILLPQQLRIRALLQAFAKTSLNSCPRGKDTYRNAFPTSAEELQWSHFALLPLTVVITTTWQPWNMSLLSTLRP